MKYILYAFFSLEKGRVEFNSIKSSFLTICGSQTSLMEVAATAV